MDRSAAVVSAAEVWARSRLAGAKAKSERTAMVNVAESISGSAAGAALAEYLVEDESRPPPRR